MRTVRRLLLLAVIVVAVATILRRRPGPTPPSIVTSAAPRSSWPSLDVATWVAPSDGIAPDGYPVKANDSSRIFHVPGGRFYERTRPDRCYADAAGAIADGYRAAKA